MPIKFASDALVLPSGLLLFDPFDANGNPTGEIELANSDVFSVNIANEKHEEYGGDGKVADKLLEFTTRINRGGNIEAKNITASGLELFLQATAGIKTTSAASEVAQPINGGNGVKQGRRYQLGVIAASRPSGVRDVSNVAIKTGGTTHTLNTDYVLDATMAWIYIVPGGGIADDTVITSDFDTLARSWEEIATDDLGAREGALRWIADNTSGVNRDLFAPRAVLNPSGDLSFKSAERNEVQKISFEVAFLKPDDGIRTAIYLNGRPYA